MSEYVRVKTRYKNLACLKAALQDCGLTQMQVEEGQKGQSVSLNGYQTGRTAQLVIRRQVVGTSADIGFAIGEDGAYSLVVDSDDRSKINEKLKSLSSRYSYHVIKTLAEQNNYLVVSQSKSKGKTRIMLRRWQ